MASFEKRERGAFSAGVSRRGIILDLLSSAPLMSAEPRDKHYVIELDDSFVLELRYGTRILKFRARDIMAYFEVPEAPPDTEGIVVIPTSH